MTTYAITGATGHFGQAAIKQLKALAPADATIIALARNTEKAAALVPAGVAVRQADYEQPATLTAALQGVDKLLFISSQPGGQLARAAQHQNVVTAAKAAGVGYIAYTSFPHADTSTTPLAADHRATEKMIEDAGLAHSFLRNNWYLENEAATLAAGAAGQPFVYSAGAGQAGWALEREYAEGAVRVLLTQTPKAIYEFSGAPRTYADLAAAIDGNVQVVAVDDAAYQAGLEKAGLDAGTAALVTSFQTLIREGQLAGTTDDLATVLGRPLTSLADAIKVVLATA
ncbi:NAD(P)H-binding protein [Lacticaseibacillus yichunensis]|uniref:NAD(P)H-binding protein n=1 Tax=Lacticaseibacillus yichunensis TaxID=2486015 RepID=A0ABW4CS20_9LACO|nr:NAD(P)H-binding protein [Lacticaseibacillus yichunensis]